MTMISKNIYIDKLDDIVNKYNNTFHRTMKMKSVVIKRRPYIESSKKIMKKTLNLKLVISKYKNIFAKGYTLNWSEEVFFD